MSLPGQILRNIIMHTQIRIACTINSVVISTRQLRVWYYEWCLVVLLLFLKKKIKNTEPNASFRHIQKKKSHSFPSASEMHCLQQRFRKMKEKENFLFLISQSHS